MYLMYLVVVFPLSISVYIQQKYLYEAISQRTKTMIVCVELINLTKC